MGSFYRGQHEFVFVVSSIKWLSRTPSRAGTVAGTCQHHILHYKQMQTSNAIKLAERDGRRGIFERITRGLQEAAEASRVESDPERALSHITRIAQATLGHAERNESEGAFRCSGVFLLAPSRDYLILLAEHGYPPEQHRARISINDSNPGLVVRTGKPKIVPNTDEDPNFRQILSTVRVGSSCYLPVVWKRRVLGMFNVAAEARYALSEIDRDMGLLFANLAAATWIALDGPRFLDQVSASLPRSSAP